METAATGEKYVFMIWDNHSDYLRFYPTSGTDAEQAALALLDWCEAFRVPDQVLSDGSMHFWNETLRLFTRC